MTKLTQVLDNDKLMSEKIYNYFVSCMAAIMSKPEAAPALMRSYSASCLTDFKSFLIDNSEDFPYGKIPSILVIGKKGHQYLYTDWAFDEAVKHYMQAERITHSQYLLDESIDTYKVTSRVFQADDFYLISDEDKVELINKQTGVRIEWVFKQRPDA